MKIDRIESKAINDTRGRPTLETTLYAGALTAKASVPSGKSTGSHEAKELRDADGGVDTAISNVTGEIAQALDSREFDTPDELDAFLIELDGTPDKSRLGANAILSMSIAAQRLFAQAAGVPLWKAISERAGTKPEPPRLYVNVMNGGVHADFRLPFQEYLLVVEGRTSDALPVARSAFAELGKTLGDVPMGDEGGYSPTFGTIEEPFDILSSIACEHADTLIAIDAAANELRHGDGYRLLDKNHSTHELRELYEHLVREYPFHSIEDPYSEDADADFAALTRALGEQILIVGDDFTVTNPKRIEHAATERAINAVLIKPNQIGSVKEAIEAVRKTHENGWQSICSHRSGETDDTFIADFAYGVGAHGIKAGGLGQKERLEKYERLLEIEEEANI